MKPLIVAAAAVTLLWATPCFPCNTDSDCRPGKKCISAPGQSVGVCIEGELGELAEPAERTEGNDLKQAAKNPCQFDRQCDPNEYCFRPGNSEPYGICVRK